MLSQATSQADFVQQRGVPDLDPERKLSLLSLLGTEEEVRSQVLISCMYLTFFNTCLFLFPKSLVSKRAFKGHPQWSQSRLHFYPKQPMGQEPPKVPAMLTHTWKPSPWMLGQDFCEFKASLGCSMLSRLHGAIPWDSVLKTKPNKPISFVQWELHVVKMVS